MTDFHNWISTDAAFWRGNYRMWMRAGGRLPLLVVFCALAASAQNWPSFRGPRASPVADGMNPPTSWDVEKGNHIAWKTLIPGLAHSSPVIWGNRIFLTKAISSDPNTTFQFPLKGEPRVARHPHNSYAAATPATDGRHLVAFFGSEGLYAFDLSGKLLWKQEVGVLDQGAFDVPDYKWGYASSPGLI